ncbi:HET-domain-containing protein [Hypoxylon sp. EC38]|nr:HET-domain-containing protein [Hypoxylon sp. EC38]
MFRYNYAPLESPSTDIRLVTILPGKFDDPIRIKITHARLDPPVQDDKPKRLSVKEIRESLPEDCLVYETIEGRVLFNILNEDGKWYSSWSHPDPSFPRERYDRADQKDEQSQSELKYEALSYVWGSSRRRKTAIVETLEKNMGFKAKFRTRRLRITRNLAGAIRHLRYEDDYRTMWIDAICINQRDAGERSEQVQRMSLIFSLASRVVAWLGPRSSSSSLAFSKLDHLGRQMEFTKDLWLISSPDSDQPDWFKGAVPLPYETDVWHAISELSLGDWFTRLWVVQEIHLGSADSILKCGHDEILWSLFRRAILCIIDKQEGVPEATTDRIGRLRDMCRDIGANLFESTLYNFHDRSCEDDRDRIYGLMNFAPPQIATHIQVDYTISAAEVFKQVFLACTKQQKRLAQLPLCGIRHSTSTSLEWPTWVPNWSQPIYITSHPNRGFCTSGISASRAIRMNRDRLEVTALYFSTVSWVGSQINANEFSDFVKTYKRIELNQAQESQYPTGGTYQTAWLQVLTLSRDGDRFLEANYPTLAELSEAVATAETDEAVANGKVSTWYKNIIISWINKCYLFSTQNGYVGMISGVPQQGDKVFVILGCDVPMLLRPTTTGEYKVIGDCYGMLHGIMYGEAILGPIPRPWKVVILREEDWRHRAHYWKVNIDDESIEEKSTEDPRLEQIPIPPEWEPIEWERTRADPLNCKKFRNRDTGEVINSDPRLFPEALEARGVPLRTITLI